MSLFLDQKYLTLISNKLPLFTKKKDFTYNCRCVLCGDSVKKAKKARGYFFAYKTDLMYKCYNCDASMKFSSFLKITDPGIFNQYSFEKYTENQSLSKPPAPVIFEQPVFKSSDTRLIDSLFDRLDKLPKDHEAVQYCNKRKIPSTELSRIYYIDNIKNIVQLNESYKNSILTEEPRIVFPFFDQNDQLSGVTCRGIRDEALRYITVKIKENVPLIFGLDAIDLSQDVYVVEGPIDSLFVKNSIAINGTTLSKLEDLKLNKDKLIVVFDNQPRNKEICKIVEKTIDNGFNVVIWPQNIVEKDINEMVVSNININRIMETNVFKGLEAKVKYIAWKRC